MSRTDTVLLTVSVGILGYIVWMLAVETGDAVLREAEYYRRIARLSQRLARHFGEIGLAAELEYREVLDKNRMN